jgi:hypothetical protein
VWKWKRAATRAGLNDCSESFSLNCGSETSRDQYKASTPAEDGSPGCGADSEMNAGRSLSPEANKPSSC